MIRVLVTGRLHGVPEVRTGKSGKPFTTAKLIADAGEESGVWCSVIAFAAQGERLAGLKDGDAVSVAGRATVQAYQSKHGELRASLSIVVDELAAVRRAPSETKRANRETKPSLGPALDGIYRPAATQTAFDDLEEVPF